MAAQAKSNARGECHRQHKLPARIYGVSLPRSRPHHLEVTGCFIAVAVTMTPASRTAFGCGTHAAAAAAAGRTVERAAKMTCMMIGNQEAGYDNGLLW